MGDGSNPATAGITSLARLTYQGTVAFYSSLADGDGVGGPVISDDGRYVAFEAAMAFPGGGLPGQPPVDMVPNADGYPHIYLRDRQANTTVQVDVPSFTPSYKPAISADGRYVAFLGVAPALAGGNHSGGVWVGDTVTGNVEQESVSPTGDPADCVQVGPYGNAYPYPIGVGQCRYNSLSQVWGPAISADGRFVAFTLPAQNLGTCNGPNNACSADGTQYLYSTRTSNHTLFQVRRL